jgi:hypothetical protein
LGSADFGAKTGELVPEGSREFREEQPAKVVLGRRSFAEVVGLSKSSEEECFYAHKELITRVPRWSKEASAVLEVLASDCTGREKVPLKIQSLSGVALASVEVGGCHRKTQSLPGMTHTSVVAGVCHWNSGVQAAKQSVQVAQSQAISSVGVTCPVI